MYKLSDLWQAILESLIRFWGNRFKPKEDEFKNYLKLELERERVEKQRFLNVITEIAVPRPVQEEESKTDWKPIARPHWTVRAKQMEEMRKAQNQKVAELEKEVGIE